MKDKTAGIAATLSHNEYNDALFNIKYLRHSVNRIQSIDDGVGTSEINKIFFLPYFDDKIYIKSNGCYGLALCY